MDSPIPENLKREIEDLRQRLEEAEAIVSAIRKHEVDAFVVQPQEGQEGVLVLDGVDKPYRLLIERMQQGAAILTTDGTVIYANGRLSELFEAPAGAMPGSDFLQHIDPQERGRFVTLLAEAPEQDVEGETLLLRKDGTTLPALLNLTPMLDPAGVLCLIVTDLTQQKRYAAEREHFVQEQAARAAAEQVAAVLRSADRRKDEFLAMLGHELRNPLAPLRNGLQVLNLLGPHEPAALRTREMMERQLEGLIRMVDDLLDVGRVTQGKIELQKEAADLTLVVTRALESSRSLIDARGHSIEVTLPQEPVRVEVDQVRLTQVVTNLLNNAAKFTPRDGLIRLSVSTDSPGRQAVVCVRDNGIGIAPDMISRIFDLFTQADPSAGRAEGGLGVGLTLSQRLVEMHDGTLDVTSDGIGKGSTFTVRLPIVDIEDRAEEVPASRRIVRTSATGQDVKRILVVDDNRDSAESLTMLLKLMGHDVREAYDGRSALDLLGEFIPDLLLLDIGLPGMNGYDVAKEVRSRPSLNRTRLVAVSGYGSPEDRTASRSAGFDAHFVKPVELSSIQSLLSET